MDMFLNVRLLETIYLSFGDEVPARTEGPGVCFFLRRRPFGKRQYVIVHKVQLPLPTYASSNDR